jgi:hypothetical protein
MRRKAIVVFFHARYHLPLRAANEAHLLCWGRYAQHRVVYVNVGFGVPWALLRRLDIAAVIFDTIFLSMHWSTEYFRLRTTPCIPVIADLDCPKIAIVQDEFYNIDLVVEFLNRVGITHVLTCSDEGDWAKLYGKLDLDQVKLRTVLTGYVDDTRLEKVRCRPLANRPIHLGYRAWQNPYWLGEHGMEKVRIGQIVGAAARKRGLSIDVNNPAALDFLVGERWYDFLSRCRGVLGVEGGASVLDRDGSIRRRVEAYVGEHPAATFEETRERCFPGQDHAIRLACLSPRHFEACVSLTCQLLLEGRYNGVFEPWKHYIPIRKDYANVAEVLDALEDPGVAGRIAEQAYEDIVASGKWSYRRFVENIEDTIIKAAPLGSNLKPGAEVAFRLLRARDVLVWKRARLEASSVGAMWRRVISPARRAVVKVRSVGRRVRTYLRRGRDL